MGLEVKKNNIKITRGDSAQFLFSIRESLSRKPYDYSNDLVEFTVKKNTRTNTIIFKKRILGTMLIIEPEDTKDLPYGIYKYDVQIITPGGDVYTVIGPCNFEVTDEVNNNIIFLEEENEKDVGT